MRADNGCDIDGKDFARGQQVLNFMTQGFGVDGSVGVQHGNAFQGYLFSQQDYEPMKGAAAGANSFGRGLAVVHFQEGLDL